MSTLLFSALACSDAVVFELVLEPRLLDDQRDELLDLDPEVKVVVRSPDGEVTVTAIGRPSDGPLSLQGLAPLATGTSIGLALEGSNGAAPEALVREDVVAWGEVTLDADLGDGSLSLPVVVPRVDEIGDLGALAKPDRQLGAAFVADDDGSLWIVGGGNPDTSETIELGQSFGPRIASDRITRITRTPEGWAEPESAGALPTRTVENPAVGFLPQETAAIAGASAVVAATDGGARRIVLLGGRATIAYSGYNSPLVLHLDPATAATEVAPYDLGVGRSSNEAVALTDRRFALVGGLVGLGYPTTASLELVNPSTGVTDVVTSESLPGNTLAIGAESRGDVVVCAQANRDDDVFTPLAACLLVTPEGNPSPIAPLPVPLLGASLATLPEGDVLLTGGSPDLGGGANQSVQAGVAVDVAYRWSRDRDVWTEVAGRMTRPRAHHRSVALPDGRVLLVGGTEGAGSTFASLVNPIRCAELFDPETDTFTEAGCADAGAGVEAAVSVGPDGMVYLFEGQVGEAGPEGGSSYGLIGALPPDL